MDNLLNTRYIDYINYEYRPHVPPCNPVGIDHIRSEVISEAHFDIQDLKPTIKQPVGTGSATYNNPENKTIKIIDYEDFLNQLPADNVKGMRRCDFIAYDLENKTFFLVNELSLSSNAKNKLNDARQQLHNAILHFSKVDDIKLFINGFERKLCVFSNKTHIIETPDNMADAFDEIRKLLPEPILLDYQPITKLNFKLIETAIVDV